MGNPTELYVSLMEQLDLRRRKLRMPMWKLDDRAAVRTATLLKRYMRTRPAVARRAGGSFNTT
jgi:hypothetical protein